jgi:dTDP-glucose 4,6-dehydratase
MATALPALPTEDLDHVHAVMGTRWQRLQGQRIFMTGGTGFIGKWLLASLLDADHRFKLGCHVTVLTRDPDGFRAHAPQLANPSSVELIAGDVRHFTLDNARFDRVIHAATDVAAAASPLDTFDTCVQGTRRVFEFAARAGAKHVLLVSSGAVYGRQPPELPALPEDFTGAPDTLSPNTAYAQGKRAAEWLATNLAATHGFEVVTARCFAFVGPYLPLDGTFAIGNFLRDALAGRPITIQGDGTPWRSYLHASDMAAWLWLLAVDGRDRTAYNVGGDEAVTIAELARRVVAAAGSSATTTMSRLPVQGLASDRYVPDVRRVRSELKLPAPRTLDEAIRSTAEWHRKHAESA